MLKRCPGTGVIMSLEPDCILQEQKHHQGEPELRQYQSNQCSNQGFLHRLCKGQNTPLFPFSRKHQGCY